jgi:hypothetical protein
VNWLSLDPIAVYAAIVATGAFFLEVRRWMETGPRLRISVTSDMMLIGGDDDEDARYVMVSVTNIGSSPTTITHMVLGDFENLWSFLRGKRRWATIVPYPNKNMQAPNIPYLLMPGTQWTGLAQLRSDTDLPRRRVNGWAYAGVHCSHRARVYRGWITKGES